MFIRMLAVLCCYFLLIMASTTRSVLAGQNETRSVIIQTTMCGDKNKQPVQYISLFGSCPAFKISCSTAHSEAVLMHFSCERYIQDHCWLLSRQQCVIGSQAMPNVYTPVLMLEPSVADLAVEEAAVLEGIDHYDSKVSHEFITSTTTITTTTTATTRPTISIITTNTATITNVRAVDSIEIDPFGGDSNHSYKRSWKSHYNLAIQLTVVLLVTSLVVFSFLRFKQSNKRRSTIDLELQDLVIKHQTFATDDNIDPRNTQEKEKSQIATTSKTDKQIEAKLPDIINSRD